MNTALAESINGLYKTEVEARRPWRVANHVEAETAAYLDWFNNRRLYEYCGHMQPVKVLFLWRLQCQWSSIGSINIESPDSTGGIHGAVFIHCTMDGRQVPFGRAAQGLLVVLPVVS